MSCRLTGRQAKDILDTYVRAWDGKARSSSGKPTKHCRDVELRARASTWSDCPNPNLYETPRSKAQLLAYVDLGGGRFSSVGIKCADGSYIQPDMQVMKSFRHARAVKFVESQANPFDSYFELTPGGRLMLGLFPASATRQCGDRS